MTDFVGQFWPSALQYEVLCSTAKRILVRHANKVGGTEVWAKRLAENLRGHSVYRVIPPGVATRGIVLTPTWTSVREDVTPALLRYLPPEEISQKCQWVRSRTQGGGWPNGMILMRNGNSLLFLVSEGSQVNRAGFGAHYAGINEPPAPELYNEIVRALSVTNGELVINCAMVGRDVSWLQELVEGNPDTGVPAQAGWHQIVIPLRLEHVPWRTEEDISMQVESVLENERPMRIEAAWKGTSSGAWVKRFGDANVSRTLPQNRRWNVVVDVDWGDGPRLSIGVELYDEFQAWSLDEWNSTDGATVQEVAHQVRLMLQRNDLQVSDVDRWVGDTNKAEMGYKAKMNDLLAAELKVVVQSAQKRPGSVLYGARLLNSAAGAGKYMVHSQCKVLDRALRHWEGRDDAHKHSIDRVRYGLLDPLERLFTARQLELMRVH